MSHHKTQQALTAGEGAHNERAPQTNAATSTELVTTEHVETSVVSVPSNRARTPMTVPLRGAINDNAITERAVQGFCQGLASMPETIRELNKRVSSLEREVTILRQGDPDQLLTVPEAAALLGMSEAAVRQAARRGKLPAEYIGRRLRFKRGALLAVKRR